MIKLLDILREIKVNDPSMNDYSYKIINEKYTIAEVYIYFKDKKIFNGMFDSDRKFFSNSVVFGDANKRPLENENIKEYIKRVISSELYNFFIRIDSKIEFNLNSHNEKIGYNVWVPFDKIKRLISKNSKKLT